ncbi:MAG: ABC transporter permease [Emergencia sp.]
MKRKFPKASMTVLGIIICASIFAGVLSPYPEDFMDPSAVCVPPGKDHLLGTDNLGRDLLTMILYGGRASIAIGLTSALISTAAAVVCGAVSGLCGKLADELLMRFSELIISIPQILLIIFLQALWGQATWLSLSVIIGLTSWPNIAKIVRNEVRQIGESDYILAARTMEGGFWYILRRHLLPNFIPSIMFMVVTNIGQAIVTESTLSFLGLGLPLTTVSWGSLLSMSQEVLLSDCWWLIVIPGTVLTATLVCVTDLGEYIRRKNNRLHSNL